MDFKRVAARSFNVAKGVVLVGAAVGGFCSLFSDRPLTKLVYETLGPAFPTLISLLAGFFKSCVDAYRAISSFLLPFLQEDVRDVLIVYGVAFLPFTLNVLRYWRTLNSIKLTKRTIASLCAGSFLALCFAVDSTISPERMRAYIAFAFAFPMFTVISIGMMQFVDREKEPFQYMMRAIFTISVALFTMFYVPTAVVISDDLYILESEGGSLEYFPTLLLFGSALLLPLSIAFFIPPKEAANKRMVTKKPRAKRASKQGS